MTSQKIFDALNRQIKEELFSSYLYLAMSAYFEDTNMPGFANWMRVQAMEENAHAMKFYNYIVERGGRVVFESLDKPQAEWKNPLDAFEAALSHEKHISGCIDNLMELAGSEKDFATQNFLQWFVAEQVEEEASADGIVQQLKLIGDNRGGLFMLNRELGARTFTPPAGE